MSNNKAISSLKRNMKYPIFIIFLYIISVFLDIYTTYLASPLLKYESNYLIVQLNLGWIEIISLSTIGVTTLSTMFIYGRTYISQNNSFSSQYILSTIGIIGFTYHFVYSMFVFVNNYLSGIYLHKTKHILFTLSENYIIFKSPINYFYDYVHISVLIISIITTCILVQQSKIKLNRDSHDKLISS